MRSEVQAFAFAPPEGVEGVFGTTPLQVNAWWHPGLRLLVDTGYSGRSDWMAEVAPELVFITHHHPDHDGGAAAAAERFAGATLMAADPPRVAAAGDFADAATHETLFGDRVRVLSTPGHMRPHYALYDEAEQALYTGDMILAQGTPVAGPPDGSFAEYMDSLQTMLALKPQRVFPGHGPECAPAQIQWTYDHRRQRLDDVLSALRQQPGANVPALVDRIYVEGEGIQLVGLHRMVAEVTMKGYLDYLIAQSEVRNVDGGYDLDQP